MFSEEEFRTIKCAVASTTFGVSLKGVELDDPDSLDELLQSAKAIKNTDFFKPSLNDLTIFKAAVLFMMELLSDPETEKIYDEKVYAGLKREAEHLGRIAEKIDNAIKIIIAEKTRK